MKAIAFIFARGGSKGLPGKNTRLLSGKPLYRHAVDLALAAASQPNDVTDQLMDRALSHWSENQIVEIVGCVAMFGFLNRWNDSMATPLEDEPVEVGEKHLAKLGWNIGKHTA